MLSNMLKYARVLDDQCKQSKIFMALRDVLPSMLILMPPAQIFKFACSTTDERCHLLWDLLWVEH